MTEPLYIGPERRAIDRDMLDRVAAHGARVALKEIGLDDEHAGEDIRDIRSLLKSWRATKKEATRTAIGVLVKVATGAVLLWFISRILHMSIGPENLP